MKLPKWTFVLLAWFVEVCLKDFRSLLKRGADFEG